MSELLPVDRRSPPRVAAESGLLGTALSAPPGEAAALLEQLTPAGRALYARVREAVDELEGAVSWRTLYYPPDDSAVLIERFATLAACIRRWPAHLAAVLPGFPAEEAAAGFEPAREDVEFYFHAVFRTCERDLARLESAVGEIDAGVPAAPEKVERLCELAADLKGKFASSVMAATAALLAHTRWSNLDVEGVLFPETLEAGRLSRGLEARLAGIVAWLAELPSRVPLAAIVARWREGQRADQYVFSDLVVLRGQLGSLLLEAVRRALYSGDYHQIRQRELQLAERVNELEWIHRRTWSVPARQAAELIRAELGRLEQLLSEIAALVDAEQLASLLGESAFKGLRSQVKAPTEEGPRALAALLAHEDLRVYCNMLLGAVRRRAALTPPPAGTPGAAATPPEARATAATSGSPSRSPECRLTPTQQATLVADLDRRLAALQGPQNARWRSFHMVLRMFARHGRLPDEMLASSQPFVEELLTVLVPGVRRLAPYRGLTCELVDRLEATCQGLLARPGDAAAGDSSPFQRLERLQRFLDALGSVLERG